MLESLLNFKESKKNKGSEDTITSLLDNLLKSDNAKVTIKFETGKNTNKRDVNGNMITENTREGLSPEVQNLLDDLTGGMFSADTALPMPENERINRSPMTNDVLDKLLNGEDPQVTVPLSTLLRLASTGSPTPPGPGAGLGLGAGRGQGIGATLLQSLLGGGAPAGTMPAPPSAGLPFLEGMPTSPPAAGGGGPLVPPETPPAGGGEMPPELAALLGGGGGASAPEAPPEGDKATEELIKKLLGGR